MQITNANTSNKPSFAEQEIFHRYKLDHWLPVQDGDIDTYWNTHL